MNETQEFHSEQSNIANPQNESAVEITQNEPVKRYSDEDVNKIVKGHRMNAYEKGKADALKELQAQVEAQHQPQEKQERRDKEAQASSSKSAYSKDEFKEVIKELLPEFIQKNDTERQQQALQAQQHQELTERVKQYSEKLQEGKGKYDDFDTVLEEYDHNSFPLIPLLATDFDNTADMMYDLAKNPQKVAQITVLIKEDKTGELKAARNALKSLSNSIKEHEQAQREYGQRRKSFSQASSSYSGSKKADYSKWTREDFKRAAWNR